MMWKRQYTSWQLMVKLHALFLKEQELRQVTPTPSCFNNWNRTVQSLAVDRIRFPKNCIFTGIQLVRCSKAYKLQQNGEVPCYDRGYIILWRLRLQYPGGGFDQIHINHILLWNKKIAGETKYLFPANSRWSPVCWWFSGWWNSRESKQQQLIWDCSWNMFEQIIYSSEQISVHGRYFLTRAKL